MADTNVKNVLSVIATTGSRVRDLVIKDNQLIFIQDLGRIAFDFKGKREFYNQIVELNSETDRIELANPLKGYYFVIDTAVLWYYGTEWKQITSAPQEVVFIGVEFPELGQANKMYANTTTGNEHIAIWDEATQSYIVVADKT